MAHICLVKSCPNNRTNAKYSSHFISFFQLPLVKEMRERWLKNIGEIKKPSKIHYGVCSDHFPDDTQINADSKHHRYRRLVPDAVPTLKLNPTETGNSGAGRMCWSKKKREGNRMEYCDARVRKRKERSTELERLQQTTNHNANRVEESGKQEKAKPRVSESERSPKPRRVQQTANNNSTRTEQSGKQEKAKPRVSDQNRKRKRSNGGGTPVWKRRRRLVVQNSVADKSQDTEMPKDEDPDKQIICLTEKINYLQSLVNFYKSCEISNQKEIEQLKAKCTAYGMEVKKEQDENKKLLVGIKDLKKLNDDLINQFKSSGLNQSQSEDEKKCTLQAVLSPYFTEGQIRCIIEGRKWLRWSVNDFAAAIAFRSVSPEAYRYLRSTLNYPLPSLTSLYKWVVDELDFSEGFLMDVLVLMQEKSKSFSPLEKIAVITFGEMDLNQEICFDWWSNQTIGPCAKVQVIIARGLVGNWKQPIYYKFDQPITKAILNEALSLLHQAGYQVVACTCDMDSKEVWGELGVDLDNHFFQHPTIPNEVVYVFASVPHLLKQLTDRFVEEGFSFLGSNERFTQDLIQTIFAESISSDLSVKQESQQSSPNAQKSLKQVVWPAARTWSRPVAKAIELMGKEDALSVKNYQKFSDFIMIVSDWFDLHNSESKFGNNQLTNAYGVDVENQNRILTLMTLNVERLRVGSRRRLMRFQEGVIISNNSLRRLHEYLQAKLPGDFEYIMTRKLQQDVLENFFSCIRAMGASQDDPSGYEFRYQLRWYILGNGSKAQSSNKDNEEDDIAPCDSASSRALTPAPAPTLSLSRSASSTRNVVPGTSQSSDSVAQYQPDPEAEVVLTQELLMNVMDISPELIADNTADDWSLEENTYDDISNDTVEHHEARTRNIAVTCKESF